MSNENEGTRNAVPETVRSLVNGAAMAREFDPVLRGLRELAVRLEPLTRSLAIAAPLVQAVAREWTKWDAAESLLERGWVSNHHPKVVEPASEALGLARSATVSRGAVK